MDLKHQICFIVIALLSAAWLSEARHLRTSSIKSSTSFGRRAPMIVDEGESDAGRHPHPAARGAVAAAKPKPRLIAAGAVAIKKLVLLKFKKIIPISMILLKSTNENEAELVPVYPTSEIPSNVQFIPTPNGISGHKDVQAIAIPNELHQQLEANGLANLEHIEALLNEAQEVPSNEKDTVSIVGAVENSSDDEPLNINETDESQVLEGVNAESDPEQKLPEKQEMPNLRRIAADEVLKPGLKAAQKTSVEDIPLYFYSVKDTPQAHATVLNRQPGTFRIATANTGARRRLHS